MSDDLFVSTRKQRQPRLVTETTLPTDTRYDQDGYPIPPTWPLTEKWCLMPESRRKASSDLYLRGLAKEQSRKPRAKPLVVGNFSTAYAKQWVKANYDVGKLVDEERFDVRTRRTHDCQLGMDAIYEERGTLRLIAVQGAGVGQRESHHAKFVAAGGAAAAHARNILPIYLEFVRGQKKPVLVELWA